MNQATEQATARPWKFASTGLKMQSYGQGFAIADASCLNLVCGLFSDVNGGDETAKANAKLICQAVNSYEALLAVVEAAKQINDSLQLGSKFGVAASKLKLVSALSQLETIKH